MKRNFRKKKDYGFKKGDVFIELHQHIHQAYEEFKIDINDYWDRSYKVDINGVKLNILSIEDMLQHLCVHLFIHIRKGKFSLINFCDIVELLNIFGGKLDWIFFNEINIKYKCNVEVASILELLRKFFDVNIPDYLIVKNSFNHESLFDERFVNIIEDNQVALSESKYEIDYFQKAKGIHRKLLFLLQDLFPPKGFMIRRYNLRYSCLFVIYYPFRFFYFLLKLVLKNKKST